MPQLSPNTLVLPVAGMTCAACVYHVGEALRSVDGVAEVSVNLATERATISLDDDAGSASPDMETLARAVADAGYRLDTNPPSTTGGGVSPRAREEKRVRVRLIVAAVGGGALLLGSFPTLPWAHGLLALWWYPLLLWAVATPVQLWAGWSFYTAGWAGIRRLQPNMHTLIALGTSVAYGYSVVVVLMTLLAPGALATPGAHQLHFDMAAIIVALILLGRWLEARALSRTSGAIERLLDLRPQTAHLMAADGSISDVPVESVATGDTLAVRPGEQIPVDGEVASGTTTVDQSALTGESIPADKSTGDSVFAGALNGAGAILMRATRVGTDTTLAQVIRLVEEAQGSAAPVQRLADRVAAWFVPAVGLIALAAAVLWLFLGPDPSARYAMLTLVAVFIIACPCALGLATPTAIIVGVGRSAERGILIRSAAALETAHRVDVVALDKTGTLTTGQPEVTDVVPAPGVRTTDVLRCAASVETLSEHPLGQAVLRRVQADGLAVAPSTDFVAHAGAGVTAVVAEQGVAVGNASLMEQVGASTDAELVAAATQLAEGGATPMFVARDGRAIGVIAVADRVKPGAPDAVAALHQLGVRTVMLSGDRPEVAAAVASQCGINRYRAGMLPADKADAVAGMQAEGHTVAMAGDGINDAPALARANVGIAMGGGTDIARETADVTLMRDDLMGVATALKMSKATMRTIRQNLFWAFFYNTLLIPVAAGALYPVFTALGGVPSGLVFFFGEAGFLNPILAALAMAFSSVSVVSNSLRLRRASI
ncbi:MAG: heavy metal translocating P-type ATPase [Chloroflexota bacterium]|nr:heavy metal translocating P-type ATPase [Chloroflexota bacterium]MDE2960874.1 heavy metal translocating P-type ATPase [Chloroflexota bacterium]